MKITEVRIKLMSGTEDRLRGFCSVTFDGAFVVRDLKIISGNSGPFVAMPSRKLAIHCPKCGTKNHLKARFCNQCGGRQRSDQIPFDHDGRAKLYADIAHPINAACREMIQNRVIEEYEAELKRAQKPDYRSRYDDGYDNIETRMRMDKPVTQPPAAHKKPKESSDSAQQDGQSKEGFGSGIVE